MRLRSSPPVEARGESLLISAGAPPPGARLIWTGPDGANLYQLHVPAVLDWSEAVSRLAPGETLKGVFADSPLA
jgi:hypothetical protein